MLGGELVHGNAYVDGAPRAGWFVGPFIAREFDIRRRGSDCKRDIAHDAQLADLELKLYRHSAGDYRGKGNDPQFTFTQRHVATTMTMMLGDGDFLLVFCRGEQWELVRLQHDGDYAMFAPGIAHWWIAVKKSSIFTVCCPAEKPEMSVKIWRPDLPRGLRNALDVPDAAKPVEILGTIVRARARCARRRDA